LKGLTRITNNGAVRLSVASGDHCANMIEIKDDNKMQLKKLNF